MESGRWVGGRWSADLLKLNLKNTYFEERVRATAPGTSKGVIELLFKDFIF